MQRRRPTDGMNTYKVDVFTATHRVGKMGKVGRIAIEGILCDSFRWDAVVLSVLFFSCRLLYLACQFDVRCLTVKNNCNEN